MMNQTPNAKQAPSGYTALRGYFKPAPQGGVYLRLAVRRGDSQHDDNDPVTWEQAGPVADLMEAALCFDDQSPILDLFLLVQADEPRVRPSELEVLTNIDIEHLWQAALSNQERPVVSPCRRDGQGRWQACLPLFVCRHKAAFFHPPCPHCGQDLILCRDDRLLEKAGLPAFSASLERFLYCDQCFQDHPLFYAKAHGPQPRPDVLDGKALIEQFSRLLAKSDLAGKLPCIDCEASAQCYGPDNLLFERLAAVRFYPFYLLSQPAPSINALDFLALLSGAGAAGLQQQLTTQAKSLRLKGLQTTQETLGRGSGLLFASDSRRFAELLYLKLTFLRELIQLVAARPQSSAQVAREMSLEGVWVRLPKKSQHLPLYWNFDLQCVDGVGAPRQPAAKAALDVLQTHYFLSRAWFYVLLANDRRPFGDVLAELDTLLGRGECPEPEAIQTQAIFDPQNLFYGNAPPAVDSQWHPYWHRAVQLGLTLWQPGAETEAGAALAALAQSLDQLRGELHQALFQSAPGQAEALPESPAGQALDGPIKVILENILEQWSREVRSPQTVVQDAPAGRKPSPMRRVDADGDVEETVILTDTKSSGQVPGQAPPPSAGPMDKTMVVPPPDAPPAQPGAPPPHPSPDIEKTVLVSREQVQAPDQDVDKTVIIQQPGAPAQEDELEETVLLSPDPRQPQPSAEKQPSPAPPESQHQDDELEKTVLQAKQPPAAPGAPPARPSADQDSAGDDLDATVIIDPAKPKNRKP